MQFIHKFFRNTLGFASGFIFLIFYCTFLGQHNSGTTLMDTTATPLYALKMLIALAVLCLFLHEFSKGIKPDRKDETVIDLFATFILIALSSFAGLAITFYICQLIG